MVLARAGHPMPVLFNPKRSPTHQVIESRGMMVGMTSGETFSQSLQEVTVELLVGDLVFLYTDGLTEARNPSGEMYELDRAVRVFESHPRMRPGRLLEAVRESVSDFRDGREPEDDVTMIAFRRNS